MDRSVRRRRARGAARGERRSAPRLAAFGTSLWVDGAEVRVLDLSRDGLAVESERQLEVGRKYLFSFPDEAGKCAPFAGVVVWSRGLDVAAMGHDRPRFRVGIQRVAQLTAAGTG
jgi:PilZ domain